MPDSMVPESVINLAIYFIYVRHTSRAAESDGSAVDFLARDMLVETFFELLHLARQRRSGKLPSSMSCSKHRPIEAEIHPSPSLHHSDFLDLQRVWPNRAVINHGVNPVLSGATPTQPKKKHKESKKNKQKEKVSARSVITKVAF